MNCPNCNQPIEEGTKFCTNCGASVAQQTAEVKTEEVKPEQTVEVKTEEVKTEQPAEAKTDEVKTEPTAEVKTENTAWQAPEQPAPTMTPDTSYYEEPKKTTNGFAIAGLIVSLVTPFSLISLALSIIGLVFAIKKWNSSGKGMAIAGIVISGIELILLPVLAFIVALIFTLSPTPQPAFLLALL